MVQQKEFIVETNVSIRERVVTVNGKDEVQKVIVHEVAPMTDSLEAIAMHYKVSKVAIRTMNGFVGDDIYFLQELIIPYNGQVDITPREVSPEVKEKNEKLLRETAFDSLSEYIRNKEVKFARVRRNKYRKKGAEDYKGDGKAEASYYLDLHGYDFDKAVANYNQEHQIEVDILEAELLTSKALKGRDLYPDDKGGLCGTGGPCSIF